MFQIFTKKIFLRDSLEGFVDIHSHILPGIDDGAKQVSESIHLIKSLEALGVKQFTATPHIMQGVYENTKETIDEAYQNVIQAMEPNLMSNVALNYAAEYMLDAHFIEQLEAEQLFTIKDNYILIEMSHFQAPINLEDMISKIKTKGYVPILAHPERYTFYHDSKTYYHRLKQLGCLFQLNFLSLTDHYGNHVEKMAHYLIEEELIDFVATDTHNETHIKKLSNITLNKSLARKLPVIIKNTCRVFSKT